MAIRDAVLLGFTSGLFDLFGRRGGLVDMLVLSSAEVRMSRHIRTNQGNLRASYRRSRQVETPFDRRHPNVSTFST